MYFTKKAADFFLRFGARLTDKAATITHLWHRQSILLMLSFIVVQKYIYNKTEGHIDIYPPTRQLVSGHNSLLFSVDGWSQKILTFSRIEKCTNVLRYLLLRPIEHINRHHYSHKVSVQDKEGIAIEQGIRKNLPSGKIICVKPDYDGFVETVKNDTVISRLPLDGGQTLIIHVEYNWSYRIYQGLDQVWAASFVREKRNKNQNDHEIFNTLAGFRGQEIIISHTFGAIADKMADLPRTKLWLLKKLRHSTIPRQAFNWLKINFGGTSQNE
jgi:hypothetical protein